jgi:hypothetical protein
VLKRTTSKLRYTPLSLSLNIYIFEILLISLIINNLRFSDDEGSEIESEENEESPQHEPPQLRSKFTAAVLIAPKNLRVNSNSASSVCLPSSSSSSQHTRQQSAALMEFPSAVRNGVTSMKRKANN